MLKIYLSKLFLLISPPIKQSKMKIFTSILVFLALALIIINITLLDFHHLFEGESLVALIGIAASFCAILILLIFRMSKMIVERTKDK